MKRSASLLTTLVLLVWAGSAHSGWWSNLFGRDRSDAPRLHKALDRAPYLQQATSNRITVVWRTKLPTQAGLTYGLAPGALTERVPPEQINLTSNPGGDCDPETGEVSPPETASVQVEARIEGLAPDTTYYYAIWDGETLLEGDDPEHSFRTYPTEDAVPDLRIWAFGCGGSGDTNALAVHQAARNLVEKENRPIDLWLHAGDLAYYDGHDSDFQKKFFEIYRPTLRQIVCWPAMGNHDGHKSLASVERGPYFDAYVLPEAGQSGGVPSGTESFYSFNYGRVHFISLNSYQEDRRPTGRMAQWLKKDLSAARDRSDWIIAFWHHAPYSRGSHDSDREAPMVEMREWMVPILEKGGVDLIVHAHSHGYERSMLIDGAYATPSVARGVVLNDGDGNPNGDGEYIKPEGITPNAGLVAVVAGTGGGVFGGSGTHTLMRYSQVVFGSLLIDIEGNRLLSRMVSKDGEVLDTFSIIKRGREKAEPVADPWVPFGPVIRPGVTSFLDRMEVSMQSLSEWSGEQVHYTLDGTEPSMMLACYSEPFAITNDVTVRARAYGTQRGHVSPISEAKFVRHKGPVLPPVDLEGTRLAAGLQWLSYSGAWSVLPDFDAIAPEAKGNAPTVAPDVSGGTDFFGLSFRGYFLAPETDAYTFILESDDGSRMLIDGQVVVDNDGFHGKIAKAGVVALAKGYHAVRVDYFEGEYSETLRLLVGTPSMEPTEGGEGFWFHEAHSTGGDDAEPEPARAEGFGGEQDPDPDAGDPGGKSE